MKKLNVLITGAGAPGIAGTIYSLRNNFNNTIFKLVTTDVCDGVVGKYMSDRFYKVFPPEHIKFIPQILKIVRNEKIDVIIPQTTRETLVLSKNQHKFKEIDVRIVTSSYETIKVANDKYLLLEKSKKIGIPYPKYFLARSQKEFMDSIKLLNYPKQKIVVKPRISNGMRGLRILTEEPWRVERFLKEKPEGIEINLDSLLKILKRGRWPELLVMEYLHGEEYTVDVFRGNDGMIVLPRIREKIRSGITFDARIDLRKDIIEYSEKLSKSLNLMYCFGFQFKLSEEGIPKIIECNSRVQGTMVASTFAGCNLIYFSIMEALEKKFDASKKTIKNNLKFIRYWGGVSVYDEKLLGRI